MVILFKQDVQALVLMDLDGTMTAHSTLEKIHADFETEIVK